MNIVLPSNELLGKDIPPPRILLSTTVGSIAHGTSTPTSDHDVRAVFLQPTRVVLSLGNYQKFIETPGLDENAWELAHFLYLSLRCNPFTLEALYTKPDFASPEGLELRDLFSKFLSRYKVKGAFGGFAEQQRLDMLGLKKAKKSPKKPVPPNPKRRAKSMSHYLRVLYNGVELLQTGKMTIRIVDTEIGPKVLAAKRGEMTVEEAVAIGTQLDEQLRLAFTRSPLPDDADITPINDFLLRVREKNW